MSVIVPTFNEEARLEDTLLSIDRYLNQRPEAYEIVVVDDGSKDKTSDIVRRLSERIPELRLVQHAVNQGKGWAVRTGMLNARGKYRLFMDADGSTAIDHWMALRLALEDGADVAIGSRHAPGARIEKRQSVPRVVLGAAFRHLVRWLFGFSTRDTQNGFKAFTEESAYRIFRRQRVRAWAFDVEVLHIAKSLGYTSAEIPVRWVDDERSKVRASSMPRMLSDLLRIRLSSIATPVSGASLSSSMRVVTAENAT